MVAIGLCAFRKEIFNLAWQLISKPVQDPASGQVRRQLAVSINPTAILKVVFFISVMRQLQGKGEGSSPASLMLLASGRAGGNPLLSLFLSSLFSSSNAAYLPPIQQHYTFETLNNRYDKDGMALLKAVGAQPLAARLASRSDPLQLVHFLSPHREKYYNGTVIVLDLTGLDSSLSQLDSLRDSVSFLLSDKGVPAVRQPVSAVNTTDGMDCEIVVLLESPGGSPSEYALAAQQIMRMRKQGLKVTICVDKVAASGTLLTVSVRQGRPGA